LMGGGLLSVPTGDACGWKEINKNKKKSLRKRGGTHNREKPRKTCQERVFVRTTGGRGETGGARVHNGRNGYKNGEKGVPNQKEKQNANQKTGKSRTGKKRGE